MAPPAVEADHDLLIELRRDVKHIIKVLEGNGHEGLCAQVERHENCLTRFGVYFGMLTGAIVLGVPIALWIFDKV